MALLTLRCSVVLSLLQDWEDVDDEDGGALGSTSLSSFMDGLYGSTLFRNGFLILWPLLLGQLALPSTTVMLREIYRNLSGVCKQSSRSRL